MCISMVSVPTVLCFLFCSVAEWFVYLHILPALIPPSFLAAWGRGWGLGVSASPKTPTTVLGTRWVLSKYFDLPFIDLIREDHRHICVQLRIVAQNLYMPSHCIVYFWQFLLKYYLIVPGRLSFQFSSLFFLRWLTSLIPEGQKGFKKALDKLMSDKVINVWA